MANKNRGEVELASKETSEKYLIRVSTNALCEIENFVGMGIKSFFKTIQSREDAGGTMSMRELRAVICAGLRYKQPEITLEQAGDIIDACGFSESVTAVVDAITLQFAPDDGKKNMTPAA